ncbi:MAG: M28 family metallopeptidase [Candidatus Woesearchaeota archaeon]
MGIASRHLRSVIERLAAIDRSSCSRGEREAADWIAAQLSELGAEATVELERIHGTHWWPLGITAALGILGDSAACRGSRLVGTLLAAAGAAEVVDELSAGPRVLRWLLPKQTTANVVAWAGDREATPTLIVLAHHDAAHTSVFFDPRITAGMALRSRSGRNSAPEMLPVMAPIAIAPAVVALGALLGARRLARAGSALCAGVIASFTEIALRRTVPGANDNLTGVATLLGLARALKERPVRGLRVLLVSTGAEESILEGMRAFAARHLVDMPREETHVICVDTVGSPYLVLAEGEGMLWMHDYDPEFKDLISACAEATGVTVRRGLRIRVGTDGLLALRHGFPAAMLMSIDERGAPSNYHRPTDTPDRVEYARVEDTVRLCDCVARRLAGETGAFAEEGAVAQPDAVAEGISRAAPSEQPARRRSVAAP